jgi:hypothetical protein
VYCVSDRALRTSESGRMCRKIGALGLDDWLCARISATHNKPRRGPIMALPSRLRWNGMALPSLVYALLPPAYALHDNVEYLLSCFFLAVVYKCMPYLLSSLHPTPQTLWARERPATSILNTLHLFQLTSRLEEQPRAPIQGTHDLSKLFLASRRLNDSFELHVFQHV